MSDAPPPTEGEPRARLRLRRGEALVTRATDSASDASAGEAPREDAPPVAPPDEPPKETSRNYARAVHLTPSRRIAVGAVMAFCLLASLILGPRTLLPATAAALLLGMGALHLAGRLRGYGLQPLFAAGLVYAAGVLLLGILLLAAAPAWQRSTARYGAHLEQLLTDLTRRVAEPAAAVDEVQADPAAETAAQGTASGFDPLLARTREQTGRAGSAAIAVVRRAVQATEPVRRLRFSLFFQASFLLAFLLALPLLAGAGAPETGGGGIRLLFSLLLRFSDWLVSGIGFRILLRMAKALSVAVPVAIALHYASLDSAAFIAGCILVFSFFFAHGGSHGLLLALPVLPFAPALVHALWILVPFWLLAHLVEPRMHWRLVTWPARRAGLARAPAGTVFEAPRRKRGPGAWGWLRLAFNLALLAALAGLAFLIVPVYLAERDLHVALADAREDLSAGRRPEAIHKFENLLKAHPDEPRARMGLMEAAAEGGSPAEALAAAERLAAAPAATAPAAATAENLKDRIVALALQYLAPESVHPAPETVYENLIRALPWSGVADVREVRETAGRRLLELQPSHPWGAVALSRHHMDRGETADAIAMARAGLGAAPGYDAQVLLNLVLAEAHTQQREWNEVIEACRRGLQLAPDDADFEALLRTAEAHRDNRSPLAPGR